ncbi:hypothetical protein [Piscinibacter koreensis]|uniref:Uncharacterized protein n=1 Tax=Piscinibacter koreensis TaxID=2742824 RepID=A0A7Y6TX70_9BURK|nr:hypothetical protein [Schlegelella koreensis]NUZ06797.1 hypothetical protein [Schlegelella koreensis]
MNRTIQRARFALAGATVAIVAGCGGGGNDDASTPPQQVPASASASVDGFISYLKSLLGSDADRSEPADVGAFTPPLDETGEPQKVE